MVDCVMTPFTKGHQIGFAVAPTIFEGDDMVSVHLPVTFSTLMATVLTKVIVTLLDLPRDSLPVIGTVVSHDFRQ